MTNEGANGFVKLKSAVITPYETEGPTQGGRKMPLVEAVLERKAFYFQQRRGKLDLRAIGRIDVNRVVEEVDIDTLQEHLEDLVFSELGEGDLRLCPDDCFVKLFRLAQLTAEYLLSVQDTLAASLDGLAARHQRLQGEVESAKAEVFRHVETVARLKREVRQKRRTAHTYEQMLALAPGGGGGGADADAHYRRRPPPGPLGLPPGVVKCLLCSKMFQSDAYLQRHIAKKHGATKKKEPRQFADKPTVTTQIFVTNHEGQCVDMQVTPQTTISQIKNRFPHLSEDGRVMHRGVELKDDLTITDCSIPQNGTLVVVGQTKQESKSELKVLAEMMERLLKQNNNSSAAETGPRPSVNVDGITNLIEQKLKLFQDSIVHKLDSEKEDQWADFKDSILKQIALSPAKVSNAGDMEDDDDYRLKDTSGMDNRMSMLENQLQSKSTRADIERLEDQLELLRKSLDNTPAEKPAPVPKLNIASPKPEVKEPAPSSKPRKETPKRQQPSPSPDIPEDELTMDWTMEFEYAGHMYEVEVISGMKALDVCEQIAEEIGTAAWRVNLQRVDDREPQYLDEDCTNQEMHELYDEGVLFVDVLDKKKMVSDDEADKMAAFYDNNPSGIQAIKDQQTNFDEIDSHLHASSQRSEYDLNSTDKLGGQYINEEQLERAKNKSKKALQLLSSDGESLSEAEWNNHIEKLGQRQKQLPSSVQASLEDVKQEVERRLQSYKSGSLPSKEWLNSLRSSQSAFDIASLLRGSNDDSPLRASMPGRDSLDDTAKFESNPALLEDSTLMGTVDFNKTMNTDISVPLGETQVLEKADRYETHATQQLHEGSKNEKHVKFGEVTPPESKDSGKDDNDANEDEDDEDIDDEDLAILQISKPDPDLLSPGPETNEGFENIDEISDTYDNLGESTLDYSQSFARR